MIRPLLPVLCGVLLLGACGKREPLVSTPNLQVIEAAELPTPSRTDLVYPDRPSYIGPLDTINVEVFGVPELTRDVTVDSGGRVAMPLVGTIDANGMTATELSQKIDATLRGKYVRNPQVTVTIKGSVSQTVTIDGSVSKPGQYPVTNGTTLMRAIAASGGLGEYAKLDDVVILRTVNNKKVAGLYNLGQIRRGAYVDPMIYPNDVVVVGDSPARRMFKDFVSVAPVLAAPLVAILQ